MLAGLFFASVIGALAMPDLRALDDAGEDDARDGDEADRAGDAGETREGAGRIAAEVTAPGLYSVPGFDDDAHLTRVLPEEAGAFVVEGADPVADPPVPATLSFAVPAGDVTLAFDGRDTVPEDALSVGIGTSQPAPLSEVLAEDAAEAEVAAPVLPSVLEDEVDGVSWSPNAPDLGPAHDETPDDTSGTVSAEVAAPVLPSVIVEEVDGTSRSPAPDDLPDATPEPESADETVTATAERDVQVIDGFDPERDVLSLPLDGPEGVATAPSADGLSGEVIVADRVVARVLGVPELGLDHLAFSG